MSTWNDHTGDIDDVYHGNNIRCYGYTMDDGFCMRANTPALFLEINKQANFPIFLSFSSKQ